jgi:hypothetical protein
MQVNLAVVTVTKIEGREEKGRLADTGAGKGEALHDWAGPAIRRVSKHLLRQVSPRYLPTYLDTRSTAS